MKNTVMIMGFCVICRNPLIKKEKIEEYWGSKMNIGYDWFCEHECC